MALTATQSGIRWALVLAGFVVLLYLLDGVLTPYLVAMALAYFLDPVADYLEKKGIKRIWAVVIISVAAAVVFFSLFVLVVPVLVAQLIDFFQAVPSYFELAQSYFAGRFPNFDITNLELADRLQGMTSQIGTALANFALSSTQTIFGIVGAFVIIPVVSFFILLDWDKMIAVINRLLPLDYADDIRKVFGDIDKTLAGFVRGQGSVCLIMAAYYATILALFGLNFGVALGVMAGLLTFIPYIGAFIPGVLVVIVGGVQFWGDWAHLGLMLAVYFGGQAFEGNILSPNLVGRSVQLHPVWMLFALSAFGYLFGFAGFLIAVPVAASIGVVSRFFVGKYLRGPLYAGKQYNNQPISDDG